MQAGAGFVTVRDWFTSDSIPLMALMNGISRVSLPALLAAGALVLTTQPGLAHDHQDMGEKPWVFDIRSATMDNEHYRNTRWTGQFFQMVLMSLEPGEIIDLEVHNGHDQFFRVEAGTALVKMGEAADNLDFEATAGPGYGIMIPAGFWHQVENAGDQPLKLYTFYAPPEHPAGTVDERHDNPDRFNPVPYEEAL